MAVDSLGRRINSAAHQHLLKHGGYKSHKTTYQCWQDMKQRCFNPKSGQYKNYGGRGITVCDRWLEFAPFLEDMGPKPDGFSIERIDVNGNYCPENCKWASNDEQQSNRRDCRFLEFEGKKLTIEGWAKALGMHPATIRGRANRGYPVEMVLSKTLLRHGRTPALKAAIAQQKGAKT